MTQSRDPGGQRPRPPAHYLGYGLTWVVSTFLFMLGGQALDRRIGSEPVLTLLGALVGAAAGFWYMYRQLMVGNRGQDRKEER